MGKIPFKQSNGLINVPGTLARTDTKDAERSGRPIEVFTPENSKKIPKIGLDNCKVKLPEIADTLKLSKERVGHIVHERLGMRKL